MKPWQRLAQYRPNSHFLRLGYTLIGFFLGAFVSVMILYPYHQQSNSAVNYVATMHSCFYSLTKLSNVDVLERQEFCVKHADEMDKIFIEVGIKMDKVYDESHFQKIGLIPQFNLISFAN